MQAYYRGSNRNRSDSHRRAFEQAGIGTRNMISFVEFQLKKRQNLENRYRTPLKQLIVECANGNASFPSSIHSSDRRSAELASGKVLL